MTNATDNVQRLDRYTCMRDLTENVSRMLTRFLPLIAAALGLETAVLFYSGSPGASAFALMSLGTVLAFAVWAPAARGVPLLPMIVLQHLLIYGLPIASGHSVVSAYDTSYLNWAGVELAVFFSALALSWRLTMRIMRPSPGFAYALVGVDREGVGGLSRIGFGLVAASTLFLVLQSLGLVNFIFELLPSGSYPIFVAAISAASFCGFFLLALIVGSGGVPVLVRLAFWGLLVANCLISASGFLLSAACCVLASVTIGLFWSSGRVPWRFVFLTAILVSFFNSGKYEMRAHYWESDDEESSYPSGLLALPAIYAEWTSASAEDIFGGVSAPPDISGRTKEKHTKQQGLLERLNNLQNILYVIDAMDAGHIPPLDGATYTLIPPLLVPRILWPSKPRSHEGQVMLNVHFRRQDLESTFKTYVAWGLLPEAYGDFGPIKGSIFIGVVLGIFFAWAENFTSRKPILSTEGFVSFVVFLALANSFEMVTSVLVTSIFQSIPPFLSS